MAMIELVVALSILSMAVLPLGYLHLKERQVCRAHYYRAVAMQVVDGEMEILRAGGWKPFPPGRHSYHPSAHAAKNLPTGIFLLTIQEKRMRLEWRPSQLGQGGTVVREARLP